MLVREFLQSEMATPIFDALHRAAKQAQDKALHCVRNTDRAEEARYHLGMADGLLRASDLLNQLKKVPNG